MLSKSISKEVTFIDIPESKSREMMLSQKMPQWLVDDLLGLFSQNKNGSCSQVTDDIEIITSKKPRTIQQFIDSNLPTFGGVTPMSPTTPSTPIQDFPSNILFYNFAGNINYFFVLS